MRHAVAILGGTGFVGRHLVARLIDAGHDVTVVSRNRETRRESALAPARVISTNPYDASALAKRLAGHDVAINLVGILNERGSHGAGFRRAHVELTRAFVAGCRDAGIARVLQMSALNAGKGTSHYLVTRGEAESVLRESGLAWTLLQSSVIFGDGDGLFCRFAKLLRLLPVLPLARANARFAPVWVGDVSEAIVRSIDDARTVRRTLELCGPETMTLAQIVRTTRDVLGLRRAIVALPDTLGRMQAFAMELVPGKPFSRDNFRSLLLDSVATRNALPELGIVPTPVSAVVPDMLLGGRRQRELDAARANR